MRYRVYAIIHAECDDLGIEEETKVNSYIEESLDMLIAYFYQKHFRVPYKELGWWLEEGAREFVKDIENKWMHNEIDSFELMRDHDFLEFLQENYSAELSDDDLEDELYSLKDEVLSELDDLTTDELRELPTHVYYSISCGSIYKSDYIDIDDIIEEREEDEEEFEEEDDD